MQLGWKVNYFIEELRSLSQSSRKQYFSPWKGVQRNRSYKISFHLAREMDERFTLITNSNCTINVRARLRLSGTAPEHGKLSFTDSLKSPQNVSHAQPPSERARLGTQDRARTIMVQLPLAIKGNRPFTEVGGMANGASRTTKNVVF